MRSRGFEKTSSLKENAKLAEHMLCRGGVISYVGGTMTGAPEPPFSLAGGEEAAWAFNSLVASGSASTTAPTGVLAASPARGQLTSSMPRRAEPQNLFSDFINSRDGNGPAVTSGPQYAMVQPSYAMVQPSYDMEPLPQEYSMPPLSPFSRRGQEQLFAELKVLKDDALSPFMQSPPALQQSGASRSEIAALLEDQHRRQQESAASSQRSMSKIFEVAAGQVSESLASLRREVGEQGEATRQEVGSQGGETREVVAAQGQQTREEVAAQGQQTRDELTAVVLGAAEVVVDQVQQGGEQAATSAFAAARQSGEQAKQLLAVFKAGAASRGAPVAPVAPVAPAAPVAPVAPVAPAGAPAPSVATPPAQSTATPARSINPSGLASVPENGRRPPPAPAPQTAPVSRAAATSLSPLAAPYIPADAVPSAHATQTRTPAVATPQARSVRRRGTGGGSAPRGSAPPLESVPERQRQQFGTPSHLGQTVSSRAAKRPSRGVFQQHGSRPKPSPGNGSPRSPLAPLNAP